MTEIQLACDKSLSGTVVGEFCEQEGIAFSTDLEDDDLALLKVQDSALSLLIPSVAKKPFSLDFVSGKAAYRKHRPAKGKEPIAKACGLKSNLRPLIIDATAGFLSDSLVLAGLGAEVIAIEQHPAVYLLAKDALGRLHENGAEEAGRLQLLYGTAQERLGGLDTLLKGRSIEQGVVLYLDPMFPLEQKKQKSQVKVPMQILRALETRAEPEESYLELMKAYEFERVVVKRPRWAEPLAGKLARYSIETKQNRFDVY